VQLTTSASCRGKRRKHGGKLKEKNKSAGDFGAANLEFHVHFISSAVSRVAGTHPSLEESFPHARSLETERRRFAIT